MKYKLNNLQEFLLWLSIFSASAIFCNPTKAVFLHLITTLGFGIALFYILTFITKKKKSLINTIATSLIIFLTLHYGLETQNIAYDLIVTAIAIFYKFFFEYKGSPIINPTVFSLLIVAIASQLLHLENELFVSWWGASFNGYISLILILPWLIYGTYKWKKIPTFLTFLITHGIIALIMWHAKIFNLDTLKFIFTDSTLYFYIVVMLIEPKTSPFKIKDQIIYGLIAVIAYNLFNYLHLAYFELLAIAVANLYNFAVKIIQLRAMQKTVIKKL